jgi:hypothetical protein
VGFDAREFAMLVLSKATVAANTIVVTHQPFFNSFPTIPDQKIGIGGRTFPSAMDEGV